MLENIFQTYFILPLILPNTRTAPVVPNLHLAQITTNTGPTTSPLLGHPGYPPPGQVYSGVNINTYGAHNTPHTVVTNNNLNTAARQPYTVPVYAGQGGVYAAPRQVYAGYPTKVFATSRRDMMDLIPTPGFVALQMMNMGRSMVSDLAYNLSKAMLFMLWL